MKPTFGTLEWGKKNNGELTGTEQFHFLRNMASLAAREVTDVIRAQLGLFRTYYSGAMIAAYRKLKYDKEVYFSAAILHDIGPTESRISPLTQRCFAVSGGLQAHDFLLSKDHPAAKAQIVGNAISVHLNLHLPVRKYGEVASLVAKGAVCDLFGFEKAS